MSRASYEGGRVLRKRESCEKESHEAGRESYERRV